MRKIRIDPSNFRKYHSLILKFSDKNSPSVEKFLLFDLEEKKVYCRNSRQEYCQLDFEYTDLCTDGDVQKNFFCNAEMFLKLCQLNGDLLLEEDIFYVEGSTDSYQIPISYEDFDLPNMFETTQTTDSIEFDLSPELREDFIKLMSLVSTSKAELYGIFYRNGHLISTDATRFAYWKCSDIDIDSSLEEDMNFPIDLIQTIVSFPFQSSDHKTKISFNYSSNTLKSFLVSFNDSPVNILIPANYSLSIPEYNDDFIKNFDHEETISLNAKELISTLKFIDQFTSQANNNRFKIMVVEEDELQISVEDEEVQINKKVSILEENDALNVKDKSFWLNSSMFLTTLDSILRSSKITDDTTIKIKLDPNRPEEKGPIIDILSSVNTDDSHIVQACIIA